MTSTKHRATGLAAAGAASALLLTACGGSGTGSAGTSATSAAAAAAGGATSAAASAAGSSAAGSSAAAGDGVGCDAARGKTVGYSQPLPDPNFKEIERIMNATLSKYGVTLRPVNANLDPGKQISDINSLIQARVAVLVANPIDPNATKPAFDRARAANIPVVAQETTRGGPFFTNVTADVEAAAAGGAQDLKAAVGDGQVGAILGPPIAEVLQRENDAFLKKAGEVGLKLADQATNAKITPQDAKAIADGWKQKYGADLKGIWTFNDTSAVGVASSLGGTFMPKVASINAQPEAIPLLQGGRLLSTYDIQQDKLGQLLAYSALQAICGKTVPATITIPVVKYDAANVASYKPLSQRGTEPLTSVKFTQRDGKTYVE